jgi:hypothetical protein
VHAAVGTANGTAIVLPIGVDSQNVSTTQAAPSSSASTSSATTQTVYNDGTTAVTAAPQSNGTTKFSTQLLQSCPDLCGGAGGP